MSEIDIRTPLVSVIICTHNRETLVPRAIDSALNQKDVKVEVIVVDDCSSDDTCRVLNERYGEQITLVRLETNRRVAYATNRGFERSTGEYIALLGDDDYWSDASKLAKQLAIFYESDNEVGVVGTWWQEQHASGEIVQREPEEPDDWKDRLLRGGGIICGSTPLIRRAAWVKAGGLDERLPRGTDSDLVRRIILFGYRGRVLPVHTTVVDVGHGLTRMTSRGGWNEARRTFFAHSYLLRKYWRQYLRQPGAMYARVRSTVLAPLVALTRR